MCGTAGGHTTALNSTRRYRFYFYPTDTFAELETGGSESSTTGSPASIASARRHGSVYTICGVRRWVTARIRLFFNVNARFAVKGMLKIRLQLFLVCRTNAEHKQPARGAGQGPRPQGRAPSPLYQYRVREGRGTRSDFYGCMVVWLYGCIAGALPPSPPLPPTSQGEVKVKVSTLTLACSIACSDTTASRRQGIHLDPVPHLVLSPWIALTSRCRRLPTARAQRNARLEPTNLFLAFPWVR